MNPSFKDKALAALLVYAQGPNIAASCAKVGLGVGSFYDVLDQHPDILAKYAQIQSRRGYMMIDEAERIITDEDDPRKLRAKVDALTKLAAMMNPSRFGDRLNLQVEQKVSVVGALELAKQRILRPQRDLERVRDAEYVEVQPLSLPRATDSISDAPPRPPVNPFEDD